MKQMIASLLLLLAGAAGCKSVPDTSAAAVVVTEEEGWRRLASDEDEARLDTVAAAWDEALGAARRAGFRRAVSKEGALLAPDGALPRPAPSPGSYLCRMIRFGGTERRAPEMETFRPFFCHVGVDQGQLSITKQTGSQRPSGYLWEDQGNDHLVFLGSLALGNEDNPVAYGDDPKRDMAGLFERVGNLRFRLVIPRPRTGAKLELFELVPAPVQPED